METVKKGGKKPPRTLWSRERWDVGNFRNGHGDFDEDTERKKSASTWFFPVEVVRDCWKQK